MRKLLFILLAFPLFGQAQSLSFSGVVNADSVTKDQLFTRARSWFNENFKSSKDVLQISDKEAGELSGKGITTLPINYRALGANRTWDAGTYFTVNVWVKDGKYKYEVKDFDVDPNLSANDGRGLGVLTTAEECPTKWYMNPQKFMNTLWSGAKVAAEVKAKSLIESLNSKMTIKEKSDW